MLCFSIFGFVLQGNIGIYLRVLLAREEVYIRRFANEHINISATKYKDIEFIKLIYIYIYIYIYI